MGIDQYSLSWSLELDGPVRTVYSPMVSCYTEPNAPEPYNIYEATSAIWPLVPLAAFTSVFSSTCKNPLCSKASARHRPDLATDNSNLRAEWR